MLLLLVLLAMSLVDTADAGTDTLAMRYIGACSGVVFDVTALHVAAHKPALAT
jgi:hypothetical protein